DVEVRRVDPEVHGLVVDLEQVHVLVLGVGHQSVHQSCSIGPSPGPVLGAPKAITSAPSGPASKFRIVSLWMRTASQGFRSTISSSSFSRALPLTRTYTSSCWLW